MQTMPLVWIDGRVRRSDECGVPPDDSAYAEGRGCYSTARIRGGRPCFVDHHLRRLSRGARALRLGDLDEAAARHALHDLAGAAFPGGDGIVRVQLSRGSPRARLVAVTRPLGADPPRWSLRSASLPHEGPVLAGGHKLTNRLLHALALDEAREAGADEALLFDRRGRLVEGARSNLVAVDGAGRLVTPPLACGGVDGIARTLLVEARIGLRERELRHDDLWNARAVLCINAVRGARLAASLDGRPLGQQPGPWQERMNARLEACC